MNSDIERVLSKIDEVSKKDKKYVVFGAEKHKYKIGKKVNRTQIELFEKNNDVVLPESYIDLICEIGCSSSNIIGPHYGLYPFASHLHELSDSFGSPSSSEPINYSNLNESVWSSMTKFSNDESGHISDDQYDELSNSLFVDILPLGTQGCTYFNGLILKGPDKGKVIGIDIGLQKPIVYPYSSFLEWYESWLDAIIFDEIREGHLGHFGFVRFIKEEDAIHLLNNHDISNSLETFERILNRNSFSDSGLNLVKTSYWKANTKIKAIIVEILLKHSQVSEAVINNFAQEDIEKLVLLLSKYKIKPNNNLCEQILAAARESGSSKFLLSAYGVLDHMNHDFDDVVINLLSNDKTSNDMKSTLIYLLGKSPNVAIHLQLLESFLRDEDPQIVRTALQAMTNLMEPKHTQILEEIIENDLDNAKFLKSNAENRMIEIKKSHMGTWFSKLFRN